ncbi:hypothetical protein MMC17_001709 [Xylographa soralifera]|nr:hypothetical protein [Xylographa soralifera]
MAEQPTQPEAAAALVDEEKNMSDTVNQASDDAATDKGPGTPPEETQAPGAKAGLTVTQFWIAVVGLNMGMLLTALDFNIVATAVPIVSSEFGQYSDSSWLGTGFLVSFALVQPIYGKLGDVLGRRNMFIFATLVFILGSGLCGGSKSMTMLIWSRVIQGSGGGGIYGLVNVIFTDLVPLRDVGKYIATTAVVWGIADVAGPLLGGAFSQYVTWRWCFWINLCISPISLVITILVLRLKTPQFEFAKALKRFDYLGALTIIGGTTCLLLGISWGGSTLAWNDSRVIGCLVAGVVMLAVFMAIEHFVGDPLMPPEFLRNQTVVAVFFTQFFFGANLLGMMYYLPQFFQLVFEDSPTIAGVGLIPMMVGLLVGNPTAAMITSKFGKSQINILWGAAFEVLATGLITRWSPSTTRAEAVLVLIVLGIGQGAVMSGMLLTGQVAVSPWHIGLVTGLAIFWQTVGDIFGIAVFSAVYISNLKSSLVGIALSADQIAAILQDIQSIKTDYDPIVKAAIVQVYAESLRNGWWWTFACAVCVLIAGVFAKQHQFE